MPVRVYLDDVDITEDLKKQHPLPDDFFDGIYPGTSRNDYYDLLPCIVAHPELREYFFADSNAVHRITIQSDDTTTETRVRLLLSMKYSARNR